MAVFGMFLGHHHGIMVLATTDLEIQHMVQKFKPSGIDWDKLLESNGIVRSYQHGDWLYCRSLDLEVNLTDEEWARMMIKDVVDSIRRDLKYAKKKMDSDFYMDHWDAGYHIYIAFVTASEEYHVLYHSLLKMGHEYDHTELMFGKLWEEAGL